MNAEAYRAIKLRAMRDVVFPNQDGVLRKVFRFYSKTFHTPLHIVETLPLEEVLLAYFSEVYESLEPPERLKERTLLLETPEEKAAREAMEEEAAIADDEFLKAAEQEEKARSQEKLIAPVTEKAPINKLPPAPSLQELAKAFNDIADSLGGIPDIEDLPDIDLAGLSDEELAADHAPVRRNL